MRFGTPWFLLLLAPVAAVAVWALVRPGRRHVVVGSLALWREALRSAARAGRRVRRVNLSWLCLLVGAAAAVVAAAGPVRQMAVPRRRVAVEVWPPAELGPAGASRLRAAAERLLGRLDKADHVQVLLPAAWGPGSGGEAGGWLSPREALGSIPAMAMPAGARGLAVPPPDPDTQHVYAFGPASAVGQGGPRRTVVSVAADLPPVTVEVFAAEPLGNGQAEVFLKVRNQTGAARDAAVSLTAHDADGSVVERRQVRLLAVGSRETASEIVRVPAAAGLSARVVDPDPPEGAYGAAAFLARRPAAVRAVAFVGEDAPLLRRYVANDPALELVAELAQADLVIANGAAPPPELPALVIDPPTPPAGWRRGLALGPLDLGAADVAADDPVVADVNLAGIAVRRARPWVAIDRPVGKLLVSTNDGVLVLRSEPAGPAAEPAGSARRVQVAFSLAPENTNLSISPPLVVLLANAVRWLVPGAGGVARYETVAPLDVGPPPVGWTAVETGGPGFLGGVRLWLEPGLYRDGAGGLHALSVTGLRGGPPPEVSAIESAAAVPLPEPAPAERPIRLGPVLLAAAGLLWLAGWALRVR